MNIWDDALTERDKQVFYKAGYGKRMGYGERPAIVVIDVNYNFVGDKPEHILESTKKWRNSCGEEGWTGIGHIKQLLEAAREKRLPIFYSTSEDPREDGFDAGRWADKNTRSTEDRETRERREMGNRIIPDIAPQPEDIVIKKAKPSVFFGTTFAALLTDLQADCLIVCGTTTSGCVRATVVDGFSYNYKVTIVEEGTFDRAQTSHKASLFDMHSKYADVVHLDDTLAYIQSLKPGLFDSRKKPAVSLPEKGL